VREKVLRDHRIPREKGEDDSLTSRPPQPSRSKSAPSRPLLPPTNEVVIPAERPELAEPVGAPGRARRLSFAARYPVRWLGRHARSP